MTQSETFAFARWVEPVAALYRGRRAELIEFARTLPAEAWTTPSPDPGWTCRDLLAHVAGDTGQNLHAALRAVIAGEPVPPELFVNFDQRNARDVVDRRDRTLAELIDELEAAGEETQRLLAQLRDEDEHRAEAGLRGTLSEALRGLAVHDEVHLQQLRDATARRLTAGTDD